MNSQPAKQLDEQFIVYMLEVDARYRKMDKLSRTRVEQWVSTPANQCKSKVLCSGNTTGVWKRNRNLYAMQLLDQILNNKITKPFLQPPQSDCELPSLSKAQVVSS